MLMNSMSLSLQSFSSSSSYPSHLLENRITPAPKTVSCCRACYKVPINNTHKTPLKFKFGQPLNPLVTIAESIQTFKWKYRNYLTDPGADLIARSTGHKSAVLQSGGLGLALLSVTTTAKVRLSPFLSTLAANPTFVSGVLAWFAAQSIKVVLNFFVERKWDLRVLFASGGMPSSHSALCTAITTSVGICHGAADALFPVCLGFSLIVMYDAIGVRRHAGMQAEVLNKIIEDLFQGHPISERKLKELLGHTPSQVVAGAVLGIMVACFCCQNCLVPI